MPEFYTVSRRDLTGKKTLELYQRDSSNIYELKDFFSQEDAKNLIDELYPNGISSHGRQYLYDKYTWLYDHNTKSYISYLHIIEITFELVRLWKYPDKPSRFISLFGCLTMEDAQKFKREKCSDMGDIYKVSTDSFFKADMNLLYTASIPGNILLAEKYWRGQQGPTPFWEVLMKAPINIIGKIA